MWSHILWWLALLEVFAHATPRFNVRQFNSSSSSSLSSQQSTTPTLFVFGPDVSELSSTSAALISEPSSSLTSSTPDANAVSTTDVSSPQTEPSALSSLFSSTPTTTTPSTFLNTSTPTFGGIGLLTTTSNSIGNSSSTLIPPANDSTPTTVCTGCVLEAIRPTTISFDSRDSGTVWTDFTVTETVLTQFITYMDGTTIDTVITEEVTVSKTKVIVIGTANQTITHTTPFFTFVPAPGTTLSLSAGPTYVAYTDFWGGLDFEGDIPTEMATSGVLTTKAPGPTCDAEVFRLALGPKQTEDYYKYFIQTYTGSPPSSNTVSVAVPPAIVQYFKMDAVISDIFMGSDIATCTLRPTSLPTRSIVSPSLPVFESTQRTLKTPPNETPPASPPPLFSSTTSTYLSTTYETSETHVTRVGCLRCSTPAVAPPVFTQGIPPPSEKPHDPPPQSKQPDPPQPSQARSGEQQPPNRQPTDLPGFLASIINSPQFTSNPEQHPNNPDQSVTIGDTIVPVHPVQPTQQDLQNNPSQQNPGIVIGSNTLTPGQTTTINGIQVVVPTQGGGSRIIVGGSTIGLNPAPTTGPAVLTVGNDRITANPEGQFIVGTQTLRPGGPALTVDGSTLSLGPSGTIAVVNGVTQTLENAPFPTQPPVLTLNGHTIPATVIGGTTQFVLSGQSLTPGGVLTVDGTTFSMPVDGSGSRVIVNGVTSTFGSPVLPVITVNSQSVTASVVDGTTRFVLGPGQTLTPGGVLTVDGTTFSMPADGSGSTVIVNGVTSTLNAPGLPVLTLNSQAITASVVGGTTAFVLGPGQTLTPGGVLTVSGTTFSMPSSASGSVIVINGVTSTLGEVPMTSAAVLTIDGKTYSATVKDGTTEYILGPGTTLKPGDAVTISGTTYSLDPQGTALIFNGKTSTLPKTPARNSATTTKSALKSESLRSSAKSSSSTDLSSSSVSTTSERGPGNFIASGIGETRKQGDAVLIRGGLDRWVEGVVIGLVGWLLMLV